MKRVFMSILPMTLTATTIVAVSVYFDLSKSSWGWFQRSGSLVVLIGAVLGYRSIVRLGVSGVGGAAPFAVKAKIVSVDNSGPVQMARVAYDDETQKMLTEYANDKLAGFIGAALIVIGTVIWGYGDLLGRL